MLRQLYNISLLRSYLPKSGFIIHNISLKESSACYIVTPRTNNYIKDRRRVVTLSTIGD